MMEKDVAIVTGISRGYGRAITEGLLSEGWHVVGDARDASSLTSLLDDYGGRHLSVLAGDIQVDEHLKALVALAREHGVLRLVVNNAGLLGPSPLPLLRDLSPRDLEALFSVNVAAPLRLIQLAMPALPVGGVVINVSSDAAVESYPGWGAYGATKAALDALTGVLAAENPDLRFYALDPGDMRTDMHQEAFPEEDISDRPDPRASVPAVIVLAEGTKKSGRYRASDLMA